MITADELDRLTEATQRDEIHWTVTGRSHNAQTDHLLGLDIVSVTVRQHHHLHTTAEAYTRHRTTWTARAWLGIGNRARALIALQAAIERQTIRRRHEAQRRRQQRTDQ